MDIISYGAASKAAAILKGSKKDMGNPNETGSYDTVKERIDTVTNKVELFYKMANDIIIQNAINIMKAQAKINSITKLSKYEMNNMIFDDLLNLSNIDISKSSGYTHNATAGYITGGTIVTKIEDIGIIPERIILTASEMKDLSNIESDTQIGEYYISRDGGDSWEEIKLNTLFYFSSNKSKPGNKLVLMIKNKTNSSVLHYGITWD